MSREITPADLNDKHPHRIDFSTMAFDSLGDWASCVRVRLSIPPATIDNAIAYGKGVLGDDWHRVISIFGRAICAPDIFYFISNVPLKPRPVRSTFALYESTKDGDWWDIYDQIVRFAVSEVGYFEGPDGLATKEASSLQGARKIGKSTGLDISDEIDIVDSMIHVSATSARAGSYFPSPVLWNKDGSLRRLWSARETDLTLARMAETEIGAYHGTRLLRQRAPKAPDSVLAKTVDDLESRVKKAKEHAAGWTNFLNRYDSEFSKIVEAYDPHELPPDLRHLKTVLIERLEAVATGHQKSLKGALSQQAIDNWAACDDLDDALKEIAKQCRIGALAIGRAEDTIWKKASGAWAKVTKIEELPDKEEHKGTAAPAASLGKDGEHYRQETGIPAAKVAFEAAKKKIEAIVPLNVPIWKVGSSTTPYVPGSVPKVSAAQVILTAENPAMVTEGGIEIKNARSEPAGVYVAIQNHQVLFRGLPGTQKKFICKAEAHNLCGVAEIEIELTLP